MTGAPCLCVPPSLHLPRMGSCCPLPSPTLSPSTPGGALGEGTGRAVAGGCPAASQGRQGEVTLSRLAKVPW